MAEVLLHNNPIRDTVLKAVSFSSFAPLAVSELQQTVWAVAVV
jgi:hypothetical protein